MCTGVSAAVHKKTEIRMLPLSLPGTSCLAMLLCQRGQFAEAEGMVRTIIPLQRYANFCSRARIAIVEKLHTEFEHIYIYIYMCVAQQHGG